MMLRQFAVRFTRQQVVQVPMAFLRTSVAVSVTVKPTTQSFVLKPLPHSLPGSHKKRTTKKKTLPLTPNILAYSTCEEYQMDVICQKLSQQGLYDLRPLPEESDALYAQAHYVVGDHQRDIFLFKQGSVVFWNFNEIEAQTVLNLLKPCEEGPYDEKMVKEELEVMEFQFHNAKTRISNGKVLLNQGSEQRESSTDSVNDCGQGDPLEKYAFSNGIALSVKLAIWEATLDRYVESIESMLQDIQHGRKLAATRDHVFRKTGELFALRHHLNLSSDFLDTPDFYWDRESLEWIFIKTIKLYSIERRTKVMNEKINHCQELMELIGHHLEDKHHVRLELMIIILIVIEVIFECAHYAERFQRTDE